MASQLPYVRSRKRSDGTLAYRGFDCCDQARAANDRVGTLASLPTPLPGCPMADRCQCMVMNAEDEPDEPAMNVIPIARGRASGP